MPPTDRRRGVTRRSFAGGAAASLAVAAPAPLRGLLAAPRLPDDPFKLGVASGEPAADGFVIWTRLAPKPTEGGGMPARAIAVDWAVALDPAMRRVVHRGRVAARPEGAHAVHVEVTGLAPGRPYWYRFRAAGSQSPVGRAVTTPRAGAPLELFRFAFTSCQHWEQGHFTGYRHMVADRPDLILHLGDYIYEVGNWARFKPVRKHGAGEPMTLQDYRNRYALYRTDPDLQAAHAWCPWAVVWDDHEVENDYAADQAEGRGDPAVFLKRRAAAYQAYYEHMPLRRAQAPRGPDLKLYRRLDYGNLIGFNMLDVRQYRSDQPCGEGRRGGGNVVFDCAERLDPQRTMLGAAQERWLARQLDRSGTRWNVLAQQMLMAQLKQTARDGRVGHWSDGWDGYAAARKRLLDQLADKRVSNPVVIGGDIHSFWVTDLKADFDDPRSKTVATEFVSSSMSAVGVPYGLFSGFLPSNPHVRYFESRARGYVRCDVTPNHLVADLRGLDQVRDRNGRIKTLRSFYVENGRPGARRY